MFAAMDIEAVCVDVLSKFNGHFALLSSCLIEWVYD